MTVDYRRHAKRLAGELHMLINAWEAGFVTKSGRAKAQEVLDEYNAAVNPKSQPTLFDNPDSGTKDP